MSVEFIFFNLIKFGKNLSKSRYFIAKSIFSGFVSKKPISAFSTSNLFHSSCHAIKLGTITGISLATHSDIIAHPGLDIIKSISFMFCLIL